MATLSYHYGESTYNELTNKLMTTIEEDGSTKLTTENGEELQVHIIEELISEASKLPHPNKVVKIPHQLTDLGRWATFMIEPSKHETFKDLVHKELDLPL